MSVEADAFVRQCQPCTLANAAPTQPIPPLKLTPLPEAAWLYVGMDFVGPFPTGENLLVLVDYYSCFPEIMTKITAEALEPRLRRIFSRYGVLQRIVTDNAQTFCSTHFANLMVEYGIKHRKITPLYPQANGRSGTTQQEHQQGGENSYRRRIKLAFRARRLVIGIQKHTPLRHRAGTSSADVWP